MSLGVEGNSGQWDEINFGGWSLARHWFLISITYLTREVGFMDWKNVLLGEDQIGTPSLDVNSFMSIYVDDMNTIQMIMNRRKKKNERTERNFCII